MHSAKLKQFGHNAKQKRQGPLYFNRQREGLVIKASGFAAFLSDFSTKKITSSTFVASSGRIYSFNGRTLLLTIQVSDLALKRAESPVIP